MFNEAQLKARIMRRVYFWYGIRLLRHTATRLAAFAFSVSVLVYVISQNQLDRVLFEISTVSELFSFLAIVSSHFQWGGGYVFFIIACCLFVWFVFDCAEMLGVKMKLFSFEHTNINIDT